MAREKECKDDMNTPGAKQESNSCITHGARVVPGESKML